MALSKRFKKKEIEILPTEYKEERKEKVTLKLINNGKNKLVNTTINLKQLEAFKDTGEEQNYRHKMNCYQKINELFQSNSYTMFHLMKGALEIICAGVDAKGGSLWISEGENVICKVAVGPGSEKLPGIEVTNGEGVIGWVSQNNKSQLVYDTSVDKRFKKFGDIKTLMATPMTYDNQVIGVLEVVDKNNSSDHFENADLYFMEHLSTLLGMYIKTTRVMREQDSLIKRMSNFADLHEKFSSTIDLDELLVLVLQRAINFLDAEVGSIWLVEDHGEGIECCYAVGPTKDKVEGLKLKRGVGVIGSVIDNKAGIIVEDTTKNSNFSKAVDSKTNFQTRSMVCSPFNVKGECIGAIQIINKKGSGHFNQDDFELLNLFGNSAGMYLKNARLFHAEKKAKDFSALIEIGKQITSTLDSDSVLLTIVNLSAKVIPFDESHISTPKIGNNEKLVLRAVSGQQEIDFEDDKCKSLAKIHQLFSKIDTEFIYVQNVADFNEKLPLELKNYMELHNLKSFAAKILKDDQGIVGVYSIESEDAYLLSNEHLELLEILSSQSTVALRNVELYNTIPSAHFVKSFKENLLGKIQNFREIPLKVWQYSIGTMLAFLILLTFVKVPNNIDAKVEILPKQFTFFSQVKGVVSEIFVKEGSQIKKGDLLAQIDISDTKIELFEKESMKLKAKTEMFKLKEEGNIADFKIKENEYISLDYEVKLLNLKIQRSKIVAFEDGVVISENLDEIVGKPVNFGEEIIRVASLENVIARFEVPENSIQFVKPSQDVKFKVYGRPNDSFSEGIVLSSVSGEGRQVIESDPNKYYMAKAQIDLNQNSGLRPGMTGRGKIYSDWIPLGTFLFAKIYNFILMEILF